jgi:signal transduction histidine kinase
LIGGWRAPAARRSLVGRVVLSVAALALLATGLLYAVTIWVVRAESDVALRRGVDVELAALADIYATGGQRELVARIGDRLTMRSSGGEQAHYLVATANGRALAGDIKHWPSLSAENSEARFVTLAGGSPVFARATQLAPDLKLVAAVEYRGRTRLLARIGLAFALAGLSILGAALLLAWLAAARLRRRVAGINTALRAIETGDLSHAVPGAERPDELGELAAHVVGLLARLGDVIRAQREVTDQVAHELRTPLIHLDRELLRLIERSVDPVLTASLGSARGEARGIADLLDSLLDIASSEARRADRAGFERVDLSAIAANLAELYEDSAADLGLAFHPRIAAGIAIEGDAMQLSRAISNLLDNAFKYAGSGASVTLIVEPGPRIIVRDDGPGVPEAMRERIFERFQRGAGGGNGHGLGLALVQAIARRHGLEARCRDANPGAEFVIAPEACK